MDAEYLKQRQEKSIREKPKHAAHGVLLGARDFGMGVFKGITGIVEEPIKGASAEGVEGFFKGVGRGVIGSVVKPTVGAMDFVTQTGLGIRNTTTLFDVAATRNRPPRFFGEDKILEPYSKTKAEGAAILKELSKGRYKDELYLYHTFISHPKLGELLLIVSHDHIFMRKGKDFSKAWKENMKNIKTDSLQSTNDGLVFSLKQPQGDPPVTKRVIPCTNRQQLEEMFLHLGTIIVGKNHPKLANPQ